MKPTLARDPQCEREQFVSDLFHAISQPLTGLRCGLEVALGKPAISAQEARCALEQALHATERLYQSVLFIRQLAEADRIPPLKRVRLDEALLELHNEILPVAESMEVKMSLQEAGSTEVLAATESVSRALFLVADFALRELRAKESLSLSMLHQGTSAVIRIERHCDHALNGFELANGFDVPAARRGLALAFRLLSSMGARIESDLAGKWIEIRFPRNNHDSSEGWNSHDRVDVWMESRSVAKQTAEPAQFRLHNSAGDFSSGDKDS
jgi:signal transduction histidine kinase